MSRRRILTAGSGTAVLASLAACGGSTKQAAQTNSAKAGQPKAGGTVLTNVTIDPYDWDITYLGSDQENDLGIGYAYDSLLRYKSGPDVQYTDLSLQPGLAERWETPDPQTFIFHLRPGAKFANLPPVNGRPLTTDDVKWSFQYLSRSSPFDKLPPAQYGYMFEGLNSVETPDAGTITARFQSPFVPFINYTASHNMPILAREIYDKSGNFKDTIVGTGPWQLDTAGSAKGQRWVWKKNPTYWDAGRPYVDQITWLLIPDDSTAYAAFTTKHMDLLTAGIGGGSGNGRSPSPADAESIKKAAPDAVVTGRVSASPTHIYMNVARKPLDDVRIRKAISFALDRDEFVKVMTAGQGAWALAGAFPDTFSDAEVHQMLKYDPEQAKQLVSAAGYPNGAEIEFITPGTELGQSHVTEVQLLQAQLKKVGINLTLKTTTRDEWAGLKRQKNYSMDMTGKIVLGDIDSYLYAVFHPSSKANYGSTNDPELTKLLVAQRAESDPAKRREICRQAVKLINIDQAWALASYKGVGYTAWQPYVKGWNPNFGDSNGQIVSMWLDK
jgi:peptide/nickel transport system substrate-binding protein